MWQATGKRSLQKTDNSVELKAVVSPVEFFIYLLFCFLIILC
jgi:hypothetical protein